MYIYMSVYIYMYIYICMYNMYIRGGSRKHSVERCADDGHGEGARLGVCVSTTGRSLLCSPFVVSL